MLKFLASLPFFLLLLSACAAATGRPAPEPERAARIAVQEALGIRVQGIRWTAEGYMLDFRYQVVDPVKSVPIFDRAVKPYLVDEASGARFAVPSPPKIGPLRQDTRAPEAGRTYFVLFANPGKFLQPGGQVTVVFGDHRLEHLVIQ